MKNSNGHMKIDKGIPVPAPRGGRTRGPLATALTQLKKGDSVFIGKVHYGNASQHCQRYLGKGNYALRTEADGLRVWRTK